MSVGGVVRESLYEIEDVDSCTTTQVTGVELPASGVSIQASSRPASAVLVYRRLE